MFRLGLCNTLHQTSIWNQQRVLCTSEGPAIFKFLYPKMQFQLGFVILFCSWLIVCHAYSSARPFSKLAVNSIRVGLVRSKATSSSSTSNTADSQSATKKYQCVSCSYIFDETIGYKKRIPPGMLTNNLLLLIFFLKLNHMLP